MMDRFHLFPPQASTTSTEVDWLFVILTLVMLFFTAVIFLVITFFAIKYRRGSKVDRSNPPVGSNLLETFWTVVPVCISIGLFVCGAAGYYRMERPVANAIEVQVVGKQWMWKLQHAEGKKEINELHVPLGQAVKLTLASQDVIHSFFIPAFRLKQDAVPGRYTSEWFRPTRLGDFHLFCAEYCGTNHSRMIGKVEVMEPAAYQRWLSAGESGMSIVLEGQRLFREHGCSGCHEGNSNIHAPPLGGIYGRHIPLASGEVITADEQYLRDSILLPGKQITAGYQNLMPSFSGQLSEAEVMQIVSYLKSTGNPEAGR